MKNKLYSLIIWVTLSLMGSFSVQAQTQAILCPSVDFIQRSGEDDSIRTITKFYGEDKSYMIASFNFNPSLTDETTGFEWAILAVVHGEDFNAAFATGIDALKHVNLALSKYKENDLCIYQGDVGLFVAAYMSDFNSNKGFTDQKLLKKILDHIETLKTK